MARIDPSECSINQVAFLDMLASSEGTIKYGDDDGYNVIVGGTLFDSYADHPRKLIQLRPGLASTAAGRYQELQHNYDVYKVQLNLPDFSPVSQDKIALQHIKECRSIPLIEAGNLTEAIARCSNIWASLPGNNYAQHQNTIAMLSKAYTDAGGIIS